MRTSNHFLKNSPYYNFQITFLLCVKGNPVCPHNHHWIFWDHGKFTIYHQWSVAWHVKIKKVHPKNHEKRTCTACTVSRPLRWSSVSVTKWMCSCVHTFAMMSHSYSCNISWLSVQKTSAPKHLMLIWCYFPVWSRLTIQWKTWTKHFAEHWLFFYISAE